MSDQIFNPKPKTGDKFYIHHRAHDFEDPESLAAHINPQDCIDSAREWADQEREMDLPAGYLVLECRVIRTVS